MRKENYRKSLLVVLLSCLFLADVGAENEPRFIDNKGQLPEQVEYSLRISNADLFFEKNRLVFNFYAPELLNRHEHDEEAHQHNSEFTNHAYHVNFLNANEDVVVESVGTSYKDYINFIQPNGSFGHVNVFSKLAYRNIYPGIDLEYFGSGGHLKYDVKIAGGANPNTFQMDYQGVNSIRLKNGNLIIVNEFNSIEESIPLAYQIINGVQEAIECRYVLNGTTVSFEFPNGYNQSEELVIDPTLIFSSYTGSTSNNFGFTATYDAAGALYGGGIAFAATGTYPTTNGAYSTTNAGLVDIAVSKFSPDGTTLLYSTYIGGSSTDVPHSMIVNSLGQLVILGTTSSPNYPTSGSAYDGSYNNGTAVNYSSNGTDFENGSDIIVTVLSADGSSLIGSTFLGGADNDGLNEDTDLTYNYGDIFRGEVIVDAADNIYIASSTRSDDFPVTAGTVGQSLEGTQDACVAKFNADVTSLLWSTYLGGDNADAGYSLKLNTTGELYVTGGTEGSGFPIVGATLNTTFQGGDSDGYVVRLNPTATAIVNSSYIGTNSYDQTYFVEVDHDDDVYLYGQTEGNYTVTGGVFSDNGSKQFIQKLSPNLGTSLMSTVFGSGSAEVNISPTAFLVDVCKRIYVSGWGGTTNQSWNGDVGTTNGMTTTPDGYQLNTDGSDFYFMVLEADAASLLYATYFGGNGIAEHVDGGTSRFNSDGVIHQAVCAGCGGSDDFPTTLGVVSEINGSSCNLGVIKLNLDIPLVDVELSVDTTQSGCVPYDVTFSADILVAPEFVWYFGNGDSSLLANPTYTFDSPGTFEVLLVGTNTNCQGNQFTDTAFVTIIATASSDVVDAGLDQSICAGESAQLNASGVPGATFDWSPVGSLNSSNIDNPIASPIVTTEYVVQAVGSDGCTAFDTVLVEVGSFALTVSADTAICTGDTIQIFASGGDTYLWNPNSNISDVNVSNPLIFPSSTTTYYIESTTASGCTSLDSVAIDVQAISIAVAGPDQTICLGNTINLQASGGAVYSWSPATGLSNPNIANPEANPTTTTQYVVTVSNSLGCGTLDTLVVTVNPLPTANAGPDESICPGTSVQLQATGGATYSWSPTAGLSNPNISNPTASPIIPRIYVVTIADANGCSDSDSVFVDVFVTEALGDAAICLRDSTQLTSVGGVSWLWAPPVGLSDASSQSPNASPTTTTTYTVFAEDASGCLATDSVTVQVFALPQASAGPGFEVCIGESVVLQGSGGVGYSWEPATYLDDANAQLAISTAEATITYTLTVTDINSCTDTDSTEVVVNPLPIIDAGQDSTICANSSLVLQATGADTYLWSPIVGLSDPQSATPEAFPLVETVYSVVGTDANGCTHSDSVVISIFSVLASSGDGVICLNDSIQANVVGGQTYNWSPIDGVSDPTINNPFLSPEVNTNYTIDITSAFGCLAQTEVYIEVLSLPVAAFDASFTPSCEGVFAKFNNSSQNAQTYFWNLGDGTSTGVMSPSHTYAIGPGNLVTLVAYNNDSLCVDSVVVDYSSEWFGNDSIAIDYANIFTPNFDGINDCFKPQVDGVFSDCYELVVYNRWGELIFESIAGQAHCWDGRTKGGLMVPEGTYYYISVVRGMDHAGYVTVIYQ
jgi:gliding motility-associated-like protein